MLMSLRWTFSNYLSATSSPEEWSQRGQQYFSKGLYSKAAACFNNAGMAWRESVCQAYSDRQAALGLAQEHRSRVNAFSKAAKAFEHLASGSQGPVNPKGQRRFFIYAAECYAAIMHYTNAARAFIEARKYTEAAQHYRLSNQFEEALAVIRQHPVDQGVSEYIIYDAKLFYIRRGDLSSLRWVVGFRALLSWS